MSAKQRDMMNRLESAADFYGFTLTERKLAAAVAKIVVEEGELDMDKHPEILALMKDVENDEEVVPSERVLTEDGELIGFRRQTKDGEWHHFVPHEVA